jgi:ketosteroid isomerase-like protein
MTATIDFVRELGERWTHAEIAGDTVALAAMVTDDFRLVGPYGFVLDRRQWLDRYDSGRMVTAELTWHDIEIRDYGDAAIAIGTQTQRAAYEGAPNEGSFRVSHYFVRRNGHWAIAGIHLSLAAPPSH